MPAPVCRKRSSSIFEELPHTPPPASKRMRCSTAVSSPSATAFSSSLQPCLFPSSSVDHSKSDGGGDRSSPIAHLRFLFPEMDPQYFSPSKTLIGILVDRDGDAAARNSFSAENLPPDGSGWIELLVGEMIDASHMDDARSRTSRVLELLEKSIKARIGAEAAYTFQEQTKKLKEQVEAVLRENTILKRAVAIQNDRQKDCEAGSQELLQLKQMVSKCQEQLRTLELDNYTLAMQLKRALHNSTIPCTFGRDAF